VSFVRARKLLPVPAGPAERVKTKQSSTPCLARGRSLNWTWAPPDWPIPSLSVRPAASPWCGRGTRRTRRSISARAAGTHW